MAYTLTYNNDSNNVEISGFLVSLPFGFDTQSILQLWPDNAFAAVHLSAAKSKDVNFVNYSSALEGKDNFQLKDEYCNSQIQLNDFLPVRIISSQSADIGESLWILGGNRSTDCNIQFGGKIESQFPNFKRDAYEHYYWGGELKDEKDTLLNLSHACFDLNTTRQCLSEMIVFGPSGYKNRGGIVNWIINQGKWMQSGQQGNAVRNGQNILSLLHLHDLSRNTTLPFFDNNGRGKAQVMDAKGTVFLFQGVFSRLLPDDLFNIIKTASKGRNELETSSEMKTLRLVSQPCCQTVKDATEEIPDSTVFEGICLWDLQPRRSANNLDPASPIFL